jgi:teichoic acid transport system permease protein
MSGRAGTAVDTATYQRFTPHRAGLPNLITYFRDLWARRNFATEMSKARLRGDNVNTFFGTVWMLLDPVLQACIYFVLIMIIRGGWDNPADGVARFAHLAGALFLFMINRQAVSSGSKSVINAGKVLLNTNFPRLLIPLSTVRTAFFKFLPTIPLYLVIHMITAYWWAEDGAWSPLMLASVFFIGCMVVFAMGMAALAATVTVYFRDTAKFLPYLMRLWLYLSPVLWTPQDLEVRMDWAWLQIAAQFNPMYSIVGGYTELLQDHTWPDLYMWITAAGSSLAVMLIGFLFFISRERDFTVRVL